jgi:hypothetical protein
VKASPTGHLRSHDFEMIVKAIHNPVNSFEDKAIFRLVVCFQVRGLEGRARGIQRPGEGQITPKNLFKTFLGNL